MNETEEYCLVRYHKETGKIDTALESVGYDKLKKWALKNTPVTKDAIIFHKTTGDMKFLIIGTQNGGKLDDFVYGTNIEDICSGLLAAVNS